MNIQPILAELKQERDRLSQAIAALESIGGGIGTTVERRSPGGKRKVSALARRRMAQAQRARWAKVKSQAKATAPKRMMSAAARARIDPRPSEHRTPLYSSRVSGDP